MVSNHEVSSLVETTHKKWTDAEKFLFLPVSALLLSLITPPIAMEHQVNRQNPKHRKTNTNYLVWKLPNQLDQFEVAPQPALVMVIPGVF